MRTDPHFAKYLIFAGSLAVLAAGLAREAFVLNVGVETFVQDLRQFNLDAENSVPAWWSSAMMLMASLLLYALGANAWRAGDVLWRLWLVMAVVFLGLSMDETASFHEGVITPLRNAFGFGGILFYAWVVPALICVAGLGIFLLPLLRLLPPSLFKRLALCGGVFIGGAVGMEMVGAWLDYEGYRATAFYALSTSTEEGLELLGMSLFLAVLLDQFDPARAVVGDFATHKVVRNRTAARVTGAGQFPPVPAD